MKSLEIFLSQIFFSLEKFLKKTTTLNIFECLVFNYKIKVDSVEQCSPQFVSFVVELCNDLQLVLKDDVGRVQDLPNCAEASDGSTVCSVEPEHSDLAELSVSLTSEISNHESEDREDWDQNLCLDTEATKLAETTLAEDSRLSPSHHRRSIYTCQYCHRKYRAKCRFVKHVCKTGPKVSKARDEESVDDPEEDAPQTCGDESRDLPVYFCTVCFFTFSEKKLFDQHTHLDNSQKAELLTDMRRLQSQRKFVCGVCLEVYRSVGRIQYHVSRCRAGPYRCELCDHVAATKQLLNHHKKKQHKGVECFFCGECGLGFKLRTSLQKHQVNRHESEQHNFPCEDCGLLFHKKIHLTNHKIEVHGLERKFLCQICGNKFMNQESLSSHLESHSDKKKFQCSFCEKPFNSKEKMTLHVRIHTGERPFMCDWPSCCKSFVSKSKLSEHLQRHKGEKRHKCDLCSRKYANKLDLKAHIRKVHATQDTVQELKTGGSEHYVPPCEDPTVGAGLYSPQVVLQVDSGSGHLYNNLQFYPELVSMPQNVVLTSYEAVIGI